MSVIFRASSVGELMSYPDKDKLPDGAITVLNTMISQNLINWHDDEFDFFTTEKGKRCENESIELYNEVNDTFHVKNCIRNYIGLLTGECDILDKKESLVIDIKTAYSKKTYPLILKMSKLYEWQLRSYMHLYDVNQAELAYCLVSTPEDLIGKKDPEHWHIVDDVPNNLRVSKLRIDRDLEKEQQLLNRLDLASKYIQESVETLEFKR